MAAQSYDTHRHRPVAWMLAFVVAVAALGLAVRTVAAEPSLAHAALAMLAVAVVIGLAAMRRLATRLQDRIIRLEMQVRLARLGLTDPAARLSLRQVIALRFASDAEMPALLARAVAEDMTPDAIKRAVTMWQPDELRT